MISEQLLSILACPSCKGSLEYHPERLELWCWTEKLAFIIKDEIPVMLVDQARTLSTEELNSSE